MKRKKTILTILGFLGFGVLGWGIASMLFWSQADDSLRIMETIAGIDSNMVYVPGGTFMMGCDLDRDGNCEDDELPLHKVKLSGFYVNKYEVRQREWEAVMGGNPSNFTGCLDCPVEQVSWEDAGDFIDRLNQLSGRSYRLLTEAEWEFAARGGNRSKGYRYAGSNDLNQVGWYRENSGGQTHPVGCKAPNELGIYDMSGNVWEWCQDWYARDYYAESPQLNPKGASSEGRRVLRGGSWYGNVIVYLVSNRLFYNTDVRSVLYGFRLSRD